MPLEFIPNQPIIFEKPIGDFPCLNNDNKAYAQLLQDGDEMCMQWKMSPCDEVMCEPNMVMPTPGSDLLGAWTLFGGWSSTGSDNISFDANINTGGQANQTINPISKAVYRIRFDVTNITGTAIYKIIDSGIQNYSFNSLGSYEYYFINDGISATLIFQGPTIANPGDSITIENIEVIQWTTCWKDDLFGFRDYPSWLYSYSDLQGKFCASNSLGGDLINTNAFTTTGNYHGVQLTISDCTSGGLDVRLGSVLLGTTSGNGVFNFYGVPTSGTDLVLSKVNNFDGCVSQVKVNDYGDTSVFNVTLRGLDNSITGTGITINIFEDRLIACFKPEFLTWSRSRRACELLQVDITEPCTLTIYTSINHIQYIKDGIECTKVVESWNDGFAFGFYFGDVNNPDFVLRQRLRFLAFNPVYRNAGEEYLYSSGNTGRSFAQSQKARTAWFDYMDEYAHDCTRTQLLGQKLLIDGYAFYYPTEDYEPEWNERGAYNLAQSRVTLLHEEAIFGSTCGTIANAVCPPKLVPVPTPAQLTEAKLLVLSLDLGLIDPAAVGVYLWTIDILGGFIPIYNNNYDLTSGVDRSLFVNDIATEINNVYGTTTTSTSCTIVGSTLSASIICTGTISIPMPAVSIAIYDFSGTFCQFIPLPITFA